MKRAPLALGCIAALLGTGCNIYDIGPALAAQDAYTEPIVELSDTCTVDDVPMATSDPSSRTVSLEGFADDERTISGCNGLRVDGPDGFIRLPAVAEQRWSIHAEPKDDNTDLVMYMMPTCDPSSCTDLLDRCGAGLPESFVFSAPSEGEYVLGIDSRTTLGEVELTLVSTVCGDRRQEFGEGCDDGNRMNGDGCDRECRVEISMDRLRELEPNNWPTEANVVPLTMEQPTVSIVGRVGGACDVDYYAIRVEQPASLGVIMRDGAELPCDGSTPPLTMTLINGDGTTRRGEGTTGGEGGMCPSIEAGVAFAEALSIGTYFLSVAADRDSATVDYNLSFELTPM